MLDSTNWQDSNQVLAYYNDLDNFLYCMHPVFSGQEDIFQPDFSEFRKIRADVENVEPQLRFDAIFKRTAFYHELRHFHDSLGTTIGIERKIILERLLLEMIWQMTLVRSVKPLKIPLAAWSKRNDCPESVRQLVAYYLKFEDWFMRWYSPVPYKVSEVKQRINRVSTKDYPNVLAFQYSKDCSIPCIETDGSGEKWIYPVSTSTIAEGCALGLQIELMGTLFRDLLPVDPIIHLLQNEIVPPTYLTALTYLLDELGGAPIEFYLALGYLAMMGSKRDKSFLDRHPGWRFVRAVGIAKREKVVVSSPDDIEPATALILGRAGWTSLDEVRKTYFDYLQERMSRLAQIRDSKDSRTTRMIMLPSTDKMIQMFTGLQEAKEFIRKDPMLDVGVYIPALGFLPRPSVYGFAGKAAVVTEETMLSLQKFFVCRLLHEMIFARTIRCPYITLGLQCDEREPSCDSHFTSHDALARHREITDLRCMFQFGWHYLGLSADDLIPIDG